MNAPEVLERLSAAGLRLSVRGSNIVASPKAAATPELVNLIREHKSELLQSLAAQQAELVRLVNQIADHHGFTAVQRQETLEIAIGDQIAALECFRSLVERLTTIDLTKKVISDGN